MDEYVNLVGWATMARHEERQRLADDEIALAVLPLRSHSTMFSIK
jgi:hypothetical protein